MIKQIKLKSVFINSTKQDGSPLVDRNGKSYKMAVITNEDGAKASMFCGSFQAKDLLVIQTWKAGDTVRVCLEKKDQYINFSLPNKTDELLERVERLEKAVFKSEPMISTEAEFASKPDEPTKPELSASDIPF